MSIPAQAKTILDFIGEHEAPEGFDQYYGGIRRADAPPKPLTRMTVGEVLAWQDSIDPKYRSEAAGRFQIMEDTLRGLVRRGLVDANALFDEGTQYAAAFALLRRRGYDRFARGEMSEVDFGNRLAAEWASLPMLSGDKMGRSRYDGDGLNSALTRPEAVLAVLRQSPAQPPGPPEAPPVPVTPQTPEVGDAAQAQAPAAIAPGFRSRLPQAPRAVVPNTFLGDVADEFSDSGVVRAMADQFGPARPAPVPGFVFSEAEGYQGNEQYWRVLQRAESQEEFDLLRREIHREELRRSRIETGGRTIAPMLGAIAQPEGIASMLMIPGSMGLGFVRSGLNVGARVAALESGAEVLRSQHNPLTTPAESVFRVSAATLMGGGLGGVFGLLSRREAIAAGRQFQEDVMAMGGIAKPSGKIYGRGPGTVPERKPYTVVYDEAVDAAGAGRSATVSPDGSRVHLDAARLADEHAGKAWRELGLDDELFPTANHWAEFKARLAVAEHESALPFGGHGFDIPEQLIVLGRKIGVVQERRPGRAPAVFDAETETLRIDPDEIARLFRDKAWTKPRELEDGSRATPLDADTFKTLEDWTSFVIAHEIAHVRLARNAGETLGAYEDRINRRALEGGARYTRPSSAPADGARGAGGDTAAPPPGREGAGGANGPVDPLSGALKSYRDWHAGNQRALKKHLAKIMDRMVDGPYKRVHRRAASGQTRNLMDILALDGGLQTIAMQAGATPGASIDVLARMWLAKVHNLKGAEDKAYEAYLGFSGNPRLTDVPLRKSADIVRRRRADGSRSIGLDEFRRRASRAHITGQADEIAEVNQYAGAIKDFYKAFADDATEVGVLGALAPSARTRQIRDLLTLQERLKGQARARRARLKNEGRAGDGDPELRLIDEILKDAGTLARALDDIEGAAKGFDRDYFTRVWRADVIKENPEAFRAILRRAFSRANMPGDEIDKAVDNLIEELTNSGDAVLPGRFADTIPAAMKRRGIDIPNSELVGVRGANGERIDFIELDTMAVASNYAQRMGPFIELGRRFNGEHGLRNPHIGFKMALLDTLRTERRAHKGGSFADHWATLERDLLMMKDRVMHATMNEPWRWDNRTASVLKDWATMVFMGKAAISTLPDMSKLQMVHGLDEISRFAMMRTDETLRPLVAALEGEAQAAGALTDVALGGLIKKFAESGVDPLFLSRPERLLRAGANRYFIANFLGPITFTMRRYAGAISAHRFLDDAVKLAGGRANAEEITRLAQYGIDAKMAARIARMADDGHASFDGTAKIWTANADAWTDAGARRAYRAAILNEVDNTILVASAADKPAVIDGVFHFRAGRSETVDRLAKKMGWQKRGEFWRTQTGLGALPFQFWNYAMAATNKIAVAGLEQPNARFLGGLATMAGLGYIALSLRTPDWAWNKMTPTDKLVRIIDQSGMTGVGAEYAFMLQNGIAGITGENPMPFNYRWGRAPSGLDAALDFAGPGPSVLNNAIVGLGGLVSGDPGAARTFSWALPFRNHVFLADQFNDGIGAVQRAMR